MGVQRAECIAPEKVQAWTFHYIPAENCRTTIVGFDSPSSTLETMPRWVPDTSVAACQQCLVTFTYTTRRHHCRGCGRVLCDDCSSCRLLIPQDVMVEPPESHNTVFKFDPSEPQRVCDSCKDGLMVQQEVLRQTVAHSALPTHVERRSLSRYFNSPLRLSLRDEIIKATRTLQNFTRDNEIEGEDRVPCELILDAAGLAFITFVKCGFFFTARMGTGLVVSRLPDGTWSAPSAIASVGLGWGFQVGGELTDVVIILNTRTAVDAFCGRGSVSLGTELSLSVGPVGRTASTDFRAGDSGVTAAFSYAHSKGFFVGLSLEAGTLVTRNDANRDFYGLEVSPRALLRGHHPPPVAAAPLYNAIAEVERCAVTEPYAGTGYGDGGVTGQWVLSSVTPVEDDRPIETQQQSESTAGSWELLDRFRSNNCATSGDENGGADTPVDENTFDWSSERRQRVMAARQEMEELGTANELNTFPGGTRALLSKLSSGASAAISTVNNMINDTDIYNTENAEYENDSGDEFGEVALEDTDTDIHAGQNNTYVHKHAYTNGNNVHTYAHADNTYVVKEETQGEAGQWLEQPNSYRHPSAVSSHSNMHSSHSNMNSSHSNMNSSHSNMSSSHSNMAASHSNMISSVVMNAQNDPIIEDVAIDL